MKLHDWQGLRRLNRRPEDIKRVDEEVAEITMFADAAVNEEIEAIACMVEKEEGWKCFVNYINSAPSINKVITLRTLAAAIRARKRTQ